MHVATSICTVPGTHTHTHTHGAGTCRISLLFSGRRRCVYHVRRGVGRRAEPGQVTTNLESDINKQASNSRFALHGWYNDSRRELGVFSRSVMITSAQQLHGCSAADVVAPPTPLHPPSSRIRIVLWAIKGGTGNVSQSAPPPAAQSDCSNYLQ